MSNFNDVGEFQRKFGLPAVEKHGHGVAHEISPELCDFRLRFLLEELEELADGYGLELTWELKPKSERQDLPKIADALVDLVWVALGTAHLHAFPWPALWTDVQRANMTKERAGANGEGSKRGSAHDVVKPEGWVSPRTTEVLMAYGWQGPTLGLGAE